MKMRTAPFKNTYTNIFTKKNPCSPLKFWENTQSIRFTKLLLFMIKVCEERSETNAYCKKMDPKLDGDGPN